MWEICWLLVADQLLIAPQSWLAQRLRHPFGPFEQIVSNYCRDFLSWPHFTRWIFALWDYFWSKSMKLISNSVICCQGPELCSEWANLFAWILSAWNPLCCTSTWHSASHGPSQYHPWCRWRARSDFSMFSAVICYQMYSLMFWNRQVVLLLLLLNYHVIEIWSRRMFSFVDYCF